MRPFVLGHLLLLSLCSMAQAGSNDPAFNPTDLSGGTANGLNGSCRSIALQPDGKILVAGDFTNVNGVERDRIARLNADGSLDLSFDPGFGANAGVRALALQADGKVLVGGMFTYFNGYCRNHIVRLNADGSVDEDFNTGNGFDGSVYAFLLQEDGRIVVGGDFFHLNGAIARGLVRLNTDGSHDSGFDGGDVSIVYALTPMADGRIVVGGMFSFMSGVERRCITAIDHDGGVDLSFAPFGWGSSPVFAVKVQENGKVLAGGMIPGGIARMEANGEIDPFFGSGTTGFGGWDPWVYAMAVQSDGRILCAGRFTSYNGTACNGMARLNGDGTLDTEFSIGEGFNGDLFSMAVQPDGKALVGGLFDSVDGTPRNGIARLATADVSTDIAATNDLSLDIYPNPSSGLVYLAVHADRAASITITDPDGRQVRAPFLSGASAGPRSIDLGAYPKGVYLVRIMDGASARTERLVIQ